MKKRKSLLVNSSLQKKYLKLVILSITLPTVIIGGCLYYLIFSLLAEEIAIPEFIALTLNPVIKEINAILMFAIPAVFLILLWAAVVISHRLSGPIERLKKEMDEIAQGNRSRRIKLRKNDDLKPVADSINKLLDKIA